MRFVTLNLVQGPAVEWIDSFLREIPACAGMTTASRMTLGDNYRQAICMSSLVITTCYMTLRHPEFSSGSRGRMIDSFLREIPACAGMTTASRDDLGRQLQTCSMCVVVGDYNMLYALRHPEFSSGSRGRMIDSFLREIPACAGMTTVSRDDD